MAASAIVWNGWKRNSHFGVTRVVFEHEAQVTFDPGTKRAAPAQPSGRCRVGEAR
jgi:hypothetical protein